MTGFGGARPRPDPPLLLSLDSRLQAGSGVLSGEGVGGGGALVFGAGGSSGIPTLSSPSEPPALTSRSFPPGRAFT